MKNIFSYLLLLSTITICSSVRCNFTYQESISNYPERIINRIVNRNRLSFSIGSGAAHEFDCEDDDSNDETVGVPYRINFSHTRKNAWPSFRKPIDVDSRIGPTNTTPISKEASPFDDEEAFSDPVCPSDKQKIFPKTLPNLLNQLVVVVNHGKFRQEVTIEKCSNVSQPCNFSENFPFNVVTKCKQKYLTQTIKVLNENDQQIIDSPVYYPSGCECRIYPAKATIKN